MALHNKKTKKNSLSNIPSQEYIDLIDLLKVQASSDNEKLIYYYLCKWLEYRNIEYYTDEVGNIIATKGKADIYPCVVAHMDTVHDIYSDFKIVKSKGIDNNIILKAFSQNKQVGVGGDDKCGIFACLYLLKNIDNLKVIFFTKEEIGLIGSTNIDLNIFNNVGYIIQLDRWGNNDFICEIFNQFTISEEYNNKIEPTLLKYGYISTEGLITDSINLFNRDVGISCVNISCGYYQHHSAFEIIDINELWASVLLTLDLIKVLGENKYECKYDDYYTANKTSYIDTPYEWGNIGDSWYSDVDEFINYNTLNIESFQFALNLAGITKDIFFSSGIESSIVKKVENEYYLLTNTSLFNFNIY